ncbi:MAG: sigma 54-interacting transcriptional regulator [SAR324 cluster bacterium]|nr:sigma 54-interacting transcriptional regulator [SAR324 cluster bacterium]
MQSILVASPEKTTANRLKEYFGGTYQIVSVAEMSGCLEEFEKRRYEFTFLDMSILQSVFEKEKYTKSDYKKILQKFWKIYPTAPLVILTTAELLRNAVHAVRAGANDYLVYPIEPSEVQLVIENAFQQSKMEEELKHLRQHFWQPNSYKTVETNSPIMKKVFEAIKQVAPTLMNILLMGETGTGKGVIAHLIHQHSERHDKPFVHIHCGGIPDTLLESELFGHEKGAFTHAIQRKLGKFELANGGTIFLDEVGTMTHAAQIKLLQVLQDKIFQRVGGVHDLKADVRVIAASNIDLKKLSDEGNFRSDLYYRLNVFSLTIPPLRERMEDIHLLGQNLLEKFNKIYPKTIHDFQPEVLSAFLNYGWPGNIREFENLIERGYILESSSVFTPSSFPSELFTFEDNTITQTLNASMQLSDAREKAISSFEREYLKKVLTEYKGNINNSSKAAGVTPRQFHRMMAKYFIKKEAFKESSNSQTGKTGH